MRTTRAIMETINGIVKPNDKNWNRLCFAFTDVVKGKNFMTPNLVGFVAIRGGVAEITSGDWMGNTIYGITVVIGGKKADDKSQCAHSIEEINKVLKALGAQQ